MLRTDHCIAQILDGRRQELEPFEVKPAARQEQEGNRPAAADRRLQGEFTLNVAADSGEFYQLLPFAAGTAEQDLQCIVRKR